MRCGAVPVAQAVISAPVTWLGSDPGRVLMIWYGDRAAVQDFQGISIGARLMVTKSAGPRAPRQMLSTHGGPFKMIRGSGSHNYGFGSWTTSVQKHRKKNSRWFPDQALLVASRGYGIQYGRVLFPACSSFFFEFPSKSSSRMCLESP